LARIASSTSRKLVPMGISHLSAARNCSGHAWKKTAVATLNALLALKKLAEFGEALEFE
jgi:hypothetical protein